MNYQIIVAAGSGSRYGGNLPKQFCPLYSRPLLMNTIDRLHACDPESDIIVVLSKEMVEEWEEMCREHNFKTYHHIVTGGSSRAESVKNAVSHIEARSQSTEAGWISVHDAARPVVTRQLFNAIVEGLNDHDGALPACKLSDSIRHIEADKSSVAVNRSEYRTVQTPQIFHASKLFEAYHQPLMPEFTDDASVMEAAGFTDINLVEGDPYNIKVTNQGDMQIAELYMGLSGIAPKGE